MDTKSVAISLGDRDTSSDIWVTIEQIKNYTNSVNFQDLLQMYSNSISSNSAINYLSAGCDARSFEDGSLELDLDFYVWPSDINLNLDVALALGSVKETIIVQKERSFDIVVEFSSTVKFPYYLTGVSLKFDTKCYNKAGEEVQVNYEVLNNCIKFDKDIFAVINVKGTAHGFKYTDLIKFDNTYDFKKGSKNKITNVHETVTVTISDDKGNSEKEQEDLDIPACVTYLLETCDGEDSPILSDASVSTNEYRHVVYYSTCTGGVLLVDKERK